MSNELHFEWDENKNKLNQEKHDGISFEEATTINDEKLLEKEFDFSKAVKNPYAKRLKKSVTMNLDLEVLDYFKKQSTDSGIPYQTLINLYLLDCTKNHKTLNMQWI